MQMNNAIKILGMVGIASAMGVVMIGKNSTAAPQPVADGPRQPDNGLQFDPLSTDVLQDDLGVEVDTPMETMRTLTREVQATRDENKELVDKNEQLQEQVNRLLHMEDNIADRIERRSQDAENFVQDQNSQLQRELQRSESVINRLETRLKELEEGLTTGRRSNKPGSGKPSMSASGYDINTAGIPDGLGYDADGNPISDAIIWKNPMDAQIDPKKGGITMPEFKGVSSLTSAMDPQQIKNQEHNKQKQEYIKAYTLPANATLVGSTSMTALLGRIPIGGAVQDPYPFKLIVGPENLASNGINIPNVQGIVMSGIAKGDWTLGCVSGSINSMTFTFADGSISSFPKQAEESSSGGARNKQQFAWFSDEYGVPCVTGKRITNAPSYLAGRVGLGAVGAYAQAMAESEYTTTVSGEGTVTRSLTGEAAVAGRNQAISQGLDEVSNWLEERQQNSFDAVYVPPGTKIHIHLDQQISIDYPINGHGRKVQHEEFINYQSTAYSSLD